MKPSTSWTAILCAILAATALGLELPPLFSDHLILQRDSDARIWGTAAPGELIDVSFKGQQYQCQADGSGKWCAHLPSLEADATGAELAISGSGGVRLVIKDVIVGDVWICAGQSNMAWYVDGITEKDTYLAPSVITQPSIRLYNIRYKWSRVPQETLPETWMPSTRQSAEHFSAVGFIAGLELHRKTHVPMGLIHIGIGGGRIEAFCAPESFGSAQCEDDVTSAFSNSCKRLLAMDESELVREKQRYPLVIYNGMLAPLKGLSVRGVIWYQGEENYRDGAAYGEKMKALAWTLRATFDNPSLPIYAIMPPPWEYNGDSALDRVPALWQSLAQWSEHDPFSGFVCTSDCGDPESVHPMSKEPLSLRTARLVLFKEYGLGDDTAISPSAASAILDGDAILVTFNHPNGLTTRDGLSVSHLEVAGEDGLFTPAYGEIRDDTLIVTWPDAQAPARLRFAYDCLAIPNFVNSAGNPVIPFEITVESPSHP